MMRFVWWLVLAAPLAAQIQGMVVDAVTEAPIEGAIVRVVRTQPSVVTDDGGFFSLNTSEIAPFTLAAAAVGYYNGSVDVNARGNDPTLIIELEAVPTGITPDHPFNDPGSCAICHPNQLTEWMGSPMARTGLNRWVFDVLDGTGTAGGMNGFVYQRDSVHATAKPNSDCSACHSPVHWLTDIENAGMGDINNPTTDMQFGVQCEVCHRAQDVAEDKLNFPGVDPAAFTLLRGPQNVEFGLLGDVLFNADIMRASYNPILEARLCASCHEDNVDVDDDGDYEDAGSVPHETTYSQWVAYRDALGAENAQSCIDCHMPATDADRFCNFEPEPRQVGTIRQHDIRGTTPGFLENAVTMTASLTEGFSGVRVNVSITNDGAGHSVPTGVVIRNMILLVEVRDENGASLTATGGGTVDAVGGVGDPAQGYYAGMPGHAFYLNMRDANDTERIFYTEAEGIVSDTRLGAGETFEDTFVFDMGAIPPKFVNADVRLIYRRAYRDVVDAKGWTETGLGDPLADIQAPHFGHLMERSQLEIEVCSPKDLNGSGTVDANDRLLLNERWGEPAPFCSQTDPITDVRHFISLIGCYSD